MIPWTELARAKTAAGDDHLMWQPGTVHKIRFRGIELMPNQNDQFEGDVHFVRVRVSRPGTWAAPTAAP